MKFLLLFAAVGFAAVSNAQSTVAIAPVIEIPAPEIGDSEWTSATLTCGDTKYSFNADGTVDAELTAPGRVVLGGYDFKTWSKSDYVFAPGASMIVAKGRLHDEPGAFDHTDHPIVHMGAVMTVDIYNSANKTLPLNTVKIANSIFFPRTDSYKVSTSTVDEFCELETN